LIPKTKGRSWVAASSLCLRKVPINILGRSNGVIIYIDLGLLPNPGDIPLTLQGVAALTLGTSAFGLPFIPARVCSLKWCTLLGIPDFLVLVALKLQIRLIIIPSCAKRISPETDFLLAS